MPLFHLSFQTIPQYNRRTFELFNYLWGNSKLKRDINYEEIHVKMLINAENEKEIIMDTYS